MKNSKAMGLGAMLLVLVIGVVVLPLIVRFIDKMEPRYVSGFQNMVDGVQNVPSVPPSDKYRPDANTDYLCAVDGSGQSCPEGTFCDGPSQSCINNYIGGAVPDTGYFA
jgi:hypothetical protein